MTVLVGFNPEGCLGGHSSGMGSEQSPQQMYPLKHSFVPAEVQNYIVPVFFGPFLNGSWLAVSGRSTRGRLAKQANIGRWN